MDYMILQTINIMKNYEYKNVKDLFRLFWTL